MPMQNKTDAPSKSTGNAAAAIDALKYILDQIDNNPDKLSAGDLLCIIGDKAEAALKEPRRQCDVGTAEEQASRFAAFCYEYAESVGCKECPCGDFPFDCPAIWSQMPYTESEARE